MAIAYLKANANGSLDEGWAPYPFENEEYESIDENITESSEGSDDGDTSYLSVTLTAKKILFTHATWSPGSVSITSVKVRMQVKRTGANATIKPIVKLSGESVTVGDEETLTTGYLTYTQEFTDPGTPPWTVADVNNLEFGVESGTVGKNNTPRPTRIYLVVEYSEGTYPAATNVLIDRQSSPAEDVSELPLFSAQFNGDAPADEASHVYIQVSEDDAFATTEWDSGWLTLTPACDDGVQCTEQTYNGSDLSSAPPNGKYYVRIKFKDSSAKESAYSSTSEFTGIIHPWADDNYACRRRIFLNTDHPVVPADYAIPFELKTGNREIIATNGIFNEAVQASGGFQTERLGDVRHWVWLSEYGSDSKLGIYIKSYNYVTQTWSATTKIADAGTSFDSHHFPSLVIDLSGYIHVFYGCHYGEIQYSRSTNPNDSTSWTTPVDIGINTYHTYPIGLCVHTGRVYVFCRYNNERYYAFYYSDDNGATWSTVKKYIYNKSANAQRVYQYGFRYDKGRNRLHIAWGETDDIDPGEGFDVRTMHVSYAYSDLESTGDGFNDWYDITGTKKGETEVDYLSREDGYILQRDDLNDYFPMAIEMDGNGSPVVIISHSHSDSGPQDPCSVIAARYDSGWQLARITDQTGYQCRVGRSGMPIIRDADGVLHCRYVTSAKRAVPFIPTANGNYDEFTKVGDTNSYECVDDGVDYCDGSTTYLIKDTTVEARASFTGTGTIPSHYTVESVEIEIIAMGVGTYTGMFLRVGSTDYASGDKEPSATEWTLLSHKWTTDPSTSLAWTTSAAASVEFGVRKAPPSSSLKISKILKKVHVVTSVDGERFSGEIVEALSSDDGETWTARTMTENSAWGMPMIGFEHHYDMANQELAMIVSSGNDIFAVTETTPYGIIKPSGRDLVIYSQGGGVDTELARVYAPYPNMNPSTIRFALPSQVLAGAIAAGKDIVVYYANANGDNDTPDADPNSVYSRGYDNFEELATGSNLSGQAGWTAVQGTSVIYASPPEHTNKVYAGHKCAKLGDNAITSKALGSGLTNFYVETSMWLEGYPDTETDRIKVQLLDSGSDDFAVGIDYTNQCAGYEDGTGWHAVTSVKASRAQQHRVGLQVTASGCSAWFDGVKIADEVSAITTVDSIRLISPTFDTGSTPPAARFSYFDLIECSHKLWRRTDATITTGFTDNTISYSTNHDSTYTPTSDGKHDITDYSNIYKLEVKLKLKLTLDEPACTASVHCWISDKAEYDAASIEANDSDTVNLTYNTWVYKTFTFTDLEVGSKSVKVDFYAVTGGIDGSDVDVEFEHIKYYYELHDPEIVLDDEEWRGAYCDATFKRWVRATARVGSGHRQGKSSDVRSSVAYRSPRSAMSRIPASHRQGIDSDCRVGTESRSGREAAVLISTESRKPESVASLIDSESRQPRSASARIATSSLVSVTSSGRVSFDWLCGHVAAERVGISNRQELSATAMTAFEHREPMSSGVFIAIDNLMGVRGAQRVALAYRSGLFLQARIHEEHRSMAISSAHIDYEGSFSIKAQARIDYESLEQIISSEHIPFGARGSIKYPIRIFFESRSDISTSSRVAYEFILPVSATARTPFESQLGMQATAHIPASWLGTILVTATGRISFETLKPVASSAHVASESLWSAIADSRISCGHRQGIEIAALIGLSSRGAVMAASRINEEHRLPVTAAARIHSEWLLGISLADQVAASYRQGLTSISHIENESRQPATALGSTDYESLLSAHGGVHISAETLREILVTGYIPVCYEGTVLVSATGRIFFESRSPVSATDRIELENLRQVTQGIRLAVEYRKGLYAVSHVPISYQGKILVTASGRMSIGWRSPVSATGRSSIEQLRGITSHSIINCENRQGICSTSAVDYESRSVSRSRARCHFEHLRSVSARSRMDSETLQGLAAIARIAFSYQGDVHVTATGRMGFEWRAPVSVKGRASREHLKAVKSIADVLVAYGKRVSLNVRVDAEFRSEASGVAQFNIEWTRGVTSTVRVPVEQLLQKLAAAHIPIEYAGLLVAGLLIRGLAAAMIDLAGLDVSMTGLAEPEAEMINLAEPKADMIGLDDVGSSQIESDDLEVI